MRRCVFFTDFFAIIPSSNLSDWIHNSLDLLSSAHYSGNYDRSSAAHQQEQRHEDIYKGELSDHPRHDDDNDGDHDDDNDDDQEDEELITEFATFISLALHHAKLYDKLR